MSIYNCSACEELKETDPNLLVNGIGETECTSLKNDTGLVATDSHNDCEDLNNMNDCFIGNMATEIKAESECNWKSFVKRLIKNLYTFEKAIICVLCGLWENIHAIWDQITEIWSKINEMIQHLNAVSYVGILTLYPSQHTKYPSGTASTQSLAFNGTPVREGNLPAAILQPTPDYRGIIITNTTRVQLLVDTIVNCSLETNQHMASCYLTVTRDGQAVGQTPFITPTTYDQQVSAEAFVLNPGQSATMSYYFGIGTANGKSWFKNLFYPNGSEDAHLVLEVSGGDPRVQRSYFKVKVSSIVEQTA